VERKPGDRFAEGPLRDALVAPRRAELPFPQKRTTTAFGDMAKAINIRSILVAQGILCLLLIVACAGQEKLPLDIPEGSASATLKEFARQAEVEILFDLQIVYGVKTKAVQGEYQRDIALRMMLEDTPLDANFEKDSGAYAVFRKEI